MNTRRFWLADESAIHDVDLYLSSPVVAWAAATASGDTMHVSTKLAHLRFDMLRRFDSPASSAVSKSFRDVSRLIV
ncbi:hypothetical protein ACX800_15395 [Paenarthrobacter nitroguajacolicus]|uniref:hypothetical protein n=1 Tax=Paenarthrobacter nitroguajacolicus TaxID=211146 RepID=UPI0006D02546